MKLVKISSKTKNGPAVNKKNIFFAITFEPLEQIFLNQEYKISL
jgi:hypothetical protein